MSTKEQDHIWDVIVVGGGPAGCSAAIVLARSNRKVMIIDEGKQRNILSRGMHNYLTRDGILPPEYLSIAQEELNRYEVPLIKGIAVKAKPLAKLGFQVVDSDNNKHLCRRILLATGVTDHIPDIPGMKELWGCCVFHCPFCDGWECTDKTIGLYSKNYSGYGMALALRELSDNIILFTDGSYNLRPKQKAHLKLRGIEVVSTPIASLKAEEKSLTCVSLKNGKDIACQAFFVNHGHHSSGNLLNQLGCRCTKKGAAITNRKQETNVKGVYVAGDASIDMHFVVVAAAEGVKAAVAIHNDLLKTDNVLVDDEH